MFARLYPQSLLLLLLLLAFGLRLGVSLNNLESELAPDEQSYLLRAERAVTDLSQDKLVFRPPLYPYTLAIVFRLIGESRFIIGAFHSLVDVVSVALMYALTRALFPVADLPESVSDPAINHPRASLRTDRRTIIALLAALLFAVSPTAIGLVGTILSESVFICFTLAGLVLTVRAANSRQLLPALLGGILLALSSLTREVNAYFALLFIPIWWLLARPSRLGRTEFARKPSKVSPSLRTRLLQTALFLLGFMLVLTPWVIRNYAVDSRLLLISSSGEYNFARDNVRVAALLSTGKDDAFSDEARSDILANIRAQPPAERAAYAYRLGTDAILASGLYLIGYKAAVVGAFWNPFRFERQNLGVADLPAPLKPIASALVSSYLLALMVFATLGLVAAPDTPNKLLFAAFILYSLLLFLITHYQLRYRYPVHILMTPYAAYGIWLIATLVRERKWDRTLLTAPRLLITIFLLLLFVPLILSGAS